MRNERGYTLVITLLMITLIFIVSAAFIATSLNSANQNRQTGSKYMATQIAEMGIVYVKESIDANIDKEETDIDEVIQDIKKIMRVDVGNDNKIIDPNLNRFFTIKFDEEDDITPKGNFITLNFSSGGTADNKEALLEATLVIVVPPEDNTSGGGGMIDIGSIEEIVDGRQEQNVEQPDGNHDVAPTSSEAHIFPDSAYFPQPIRPASSGVVIVDGNGTFGNSIHLSPYSILAIYGDATIRNAIKGNPNGYVTNAQLLIAGKADTNNSIHLGQGSIFKAAEYNSTNDTVLTDGALFSVCGKGDFRDYDATSRSLTNICGNATFKNDGTKVFNSTLNIKNDATFIGFTFDNSEINVGNDMTFTNWSNINGNSTLRVFGDLYLKDGINFNDSASQIIVYGDLHVTKTQWSSLGNAHDKKVCVRGNIYTPSNWGDTNIFTEKPNTSSCESLPKGIYYNMKSLVVPDKNDFFQDCTESCVLNDKSNKVEIDLEEVTY